MVKRIAFPRVFAMKNVDAFCDSDLKITFGSEHM